MPLIDLHPSNDTYYNKVITHNFLSLAVKIARIFKKFQTSITVTLLQTKGRTRIEIVAKTASNLTNYITIRCNLVGYLVLKATRAQFRVWAWMFLPQQTNRNIPLREVHLIWIHNNTVWKQKEISNLGNLRNYTNYLITHMTWYYTQAYRCSRKSIC